MSLFWKLIAHSPLFVWTLGYYDISLKFDRSLAACWYEEKALSMLWTTVGYYVINLKYDRSLAAKYIYIFFFLWDLASCVLSNLILNVVPWRSPLWLWHNLPLLSSTLFYVWKLEFGFKHYGITLHCAASFDFQLCFDSCAVWCTL